MINMLKATLYYLLMYLRILEINSYELHPAHFLSAPGLVCKHV